MRLPTDYAIDTCDFFVYHDFDDSMLLAIPLSVLTSNHHSARKLRTNTHSRKEG